MKTDITCLILNIQQILEIKDLCDRRTSTVSQTQRTEVKLLHAVVISCLLLDTRQIPLVMSFFTFSLFSHLAHCLFSPGIAFLREPFTAFSRWSTKLSQKKRGGDNKKQEKP